MEIGNLLFGCSRGEYPVDQATYQPAFFSLLFVLKIRNLIQSIYSPKFENNVFSLTPYYWGNCTCGWDSIDNGHTRVQELQHREKCDQWRFMDLRKRYPPFSDVFDFNRCTCDYPERLDQIYEEYAREFGYTGHKPDCELEKPNFFYKPTGYALKWYKYPLRDSYANRHLELEEFKAMIDDCIRSLYAPGEKHQPQEGAVQQPWFGVPDVLRRGENV